MKTFTNLANAGMKIKSNRQTLIGRFEACLTQGGIHFRRFDYYNDKVLRSVSDEIAVNTGSSKMDYRRAVWTTYRHINAWFDTLKEFLISHGFSRLSTEEEMKELGSELYLFEVPPVDISDSSRLIILSSCPSNK